MKFEHTLTAPAPRSEVWTFLMDVERVAACIPEVQSTTLRDDGSYDGVVRIRVGPIALSLRGVFSFVEVDEAAGRVRVRAEATDSKLGGGVSAEMVWLITEPEGGTRMDITSDVALLGKLGEFGQPLIRKKADTMLAEFADALTAAIAAAR